MDIPPAAADEHVTASRHPKWVVFVARCLAIASVFVVGISAILSGMGLVKLPYELFLLNKRLPVIFRIHMAASGLALMLVLAALLANRYRDWHRPIGRLASIAVIAGGITALPSALLSEATLMARVGFFAQGCIWLVLLGAGLSAIRSGRIDKHRHAMLGMLAIASGAVWLRFAMAAAAGLQLPFQSTYAILAWASWLVPLMLVWWLTRESGAARLVPRVTGSFWGVDRPSPSGSVEDHR